jgi:hypothetical protein
MADDFAGIRQKLDRAKQNILDLQTKLDGFRKAGEYPVLPEHDDEALLKAIGYHKQREVPLWVMVLAGEIVHHLRSCFDHIAWHFSESTYRTQHYKWIQFPVFNKVPVEKADVTSWKRKTDGIKPDVLSMIEAIQPYHCPVPDDDHLAIINEMDIVDKHRELFICYGKGARILPEPLPEGIARIIRDHGEIATSDQSAALAIKLKGYGEIIPTVAFKDFGKSGSRPVIDGLSELHNYTVWQVEQFDTFLE